MGFRFRRTIKVLPGIRLNLSRSGISTSVGVRGAHVTVGHGRVRETVGVPGSGAFYTTTQSTRHEAQEAPGGGPPGRFWRRLLWIILAVLFAPIIIGLIAALFSR